MLRRYGRSPPLFLPKLADQAAMDANTSKIQQLLGYHGVIMLRQTLGWLCGPMLGFNISLQLFCCWSQILLVLPCSILKMLPLAGSVSTMSFSMLYPSSSSSNRRSRSLPAGSLPNRINWMPTCFSLPESISLFTRIWICS
jgi:hypothetical protein